MIERTYCENCIWIRPAKDQFWFWASRRYALEYAKCGHHNAVEPLKPPVREFVSLPNYTFPEPARYRQYCSTHNPTGECSDYEPMGRK